MRIIIITRHPALVDYLRDEYPALCEGATILTHVEDPGVLQDVHVVGVLPIDLAVLCGAVSVVPLALEEGDRGQELTLARIREIAGPLTTYVVRERDQLIHTIDLALDQTAATARDYHASPFRIPRISGEKILNSAYAHRCGCARCEDE